AVSPVDAIQQLFTGFVAHAKLVAPLFGFDPIPALAKINVPVFVFNGLKDVQVDPQLDAPRLEQAVRGAGHDATPFPAPHPNPRPSRGARAWGGRRPPPPPASGSYNADGRTLDAPTMSALVNWLSRLTASKS